MNKTKLQKFKCGVGALLVLLACIGAIVLFFYVLSKGIVYVLLVGFLAIVCYMLYGSWKFFYDWCQDE